MVFAVVYTATVSRMKEKKDFLNACSFGKENAVGSSPTPAL
jgi:hypothetical protein